ncbi:MAG: TonB-dependent receptor [Niabella sp.]
MYKYILSLVLLTLAFGAQAQKKNQKTETFKVLGACEMCKHRIENTLLDNKATTAVWEVNTHLVTVSFDSTKTSKDKLQKKLAEAGHDNEAYKADDETYNKLPPCCHYDRSEDFSGTKHNKTMQTVSGVVLEESIKGKLNPIANATVKSLHSNEYFITDSTGVFHIQSELPTHLAISYVGFKSDTINVTKPDLLTIILKNGKSGELKEVIVTANMQSTRVSTRSISNTLLLGSQELTKAACCNLSESFETSPSVDVSYSDAVTGIKQIQMLGLSGNYSQLITENIPEIKGLAGSYGLTFIPGPWIEGIQLTKGTGSVANGYESIAGQINIEEKKPDNAEKVLLNTYVNSMGRMEANLNLAQRLNNKWSVGLLSHADGVATKNDHQHDGFLDIPLGRQINLVNRWKYMDNNGWIGQVAIKVLNDKRTAGQVDYDKDRDRGTTNHYGVGINNEQYTVTGKLGYVFPQHKYKSLGLMVSASSYTNDSYYGLSDYLGKQKSFYANLIYQSIISNTAHKFRTGISFSNEQYDETFNAAKYKRTESVPGAFFEYTYTAPEKFSAIIGLREDYHNEFGFVTTPRINLKYDFTPSTNLRLSAGSGFRMANIFAENAGVFVSARQYEILNPSNHYGYGLEPEKAWNFGANFIHNFILNNRKGSVALDAYHTKFKNQIVVDMDANPQKILFYNLDGKSYSNSLQAELNYELFRKFDVRMAYRWLDVQTTYHGKQMEKPFVAAHRAFINLAYETANKWKFDYTAQWLSRKRIPSTEGNPPALRLAAPSPSFVQMSAQVTKIFNDKWEVYVGGENLTDYVQSHLILDAQNPFGQYFDGSMIWGPVVGRMLYAGMRFKIK